MCTFILLGFILHCILNNISFDDKNYNTKNKQQQITISVFYKHLFQYQHN